jgi:hypothetical protein
MKRRVWEINTTNKGRFRFFADSRADALYHVECLRRDGWTVLTTPKMVGWKQEAVEVPFHFPEDVAAARISNALAHQGIHLSDEQRDEIGRVIMGAYIPSSGAGAYLRVRKKRWNLPDEVTR